MNSDPNGARRRYMGEASCQSGTALRKPGRRGRVAPECVVAPGRALLIPFRSCKIPRIPLSLGPRLCQGPPLRVGAVTPRGGRSESVSTALPVLRNFVGGEHADPADGATSAIVDPCTGEPYAYAPVSAAGDVAGAMVAAEAGFEVWRDSTPAERQRALLRIADAVEARADE